MKKILFLLFFVQIAFAQQKFEKDSVVQFQKELNEHFADTASSPLKKRDLKKFKALDFFAIDERFFVKAKFIRTANEKLFEMPTTTLRKPMYLKYGELYFMIDNVACKLDVYQNIELSKMPKYATSLFLPFTDLTSGVETYGGGRYIDIEIQDALNWTINFNLCYNPYCAYNEKYSCPLTPSENDLKVAIKAGVKKFHD
jgi:hypothetical protein